jgi:hypothetical protein
VNCGEGGDTAFVDEEDTVYKNCENVFVERGSEGPNPGAKSGA